MNNLWKKHSHCLALFSLTFLPLCFSDCFHNHEKSRDFLFHAAAVKQKVVFNSWKLLESENRLLVFHVTSLSTRHGKRGRKWYSDGCREQRLGGQEFCVRKKGVDHFLRSHLLSLTCGLEIVSLG